MHQRWEAALSRQKWNQKHECKCRDCHLTNFFQRIPAGIVAPMWVTCWQLDSGGPTPRKKKTSACNEGTYVCELMQPSIPSVIHCCKRHGCPCRRKRMGRHGRCSAKDGEEKLTQQLPSIGSALDAVICDILLTKLIDVSFHHTHCCAWSLSLSLSRAENDRPLVVRSPRQG